MEFWIRVIVLVLVCGWRLTGPVGAQAPAAGGQPQGQVRSGGVSESRAKGDGAVVADDHAGTDAQTEEKGHAHGQPIQRYYHRAFFSEPWRFPNRYVYSTMRNCYWLAGTIGLLGLGLWMRRSKYL